MVLIAETIVDEEEFKKRGDEFHRKFKLLPEASFLHLQRLFERNPAVRACFETKIRFIRGGGVIVQKAKHEPSESDQMLFNSVWMDFCRDVLACFTCYGFVIVARNSRNNPVVIPPQQLRISVRETDGRRIYYLRAKDKSVVSFAPTSYTRRGSDRPPPAPESKAGLKHLMSGGPQGGGGKATGSKKRKNLPATTPNADHQVHDVHIGPDESLADDDFPDAWETPPGLRDVLVFEENPPSASGNLNSAIQSLLQMESVKNITVRLKVEADARRSNPVNYLQNTEKTPATTMNLRDQNAYGERGVESMKTRMRDDVDAMRLIGSHEEAVEELRAARPGDGDLVNSSDPVSGLMRYPLNKGAQPGHTNLVPLPRDQQLVVGTMAEAPQDLESLITIQVHDVGMVMGVPDQLWGNHRTAVAVNENLMNMFYATQRECRGTLETIFKVMLHIIYGKSNADHGHKNYDSSKSFEENIKDNEIQVAFPGLIAPEVIYDLGERGAMNETTQCKYIARFYGLPLADLDPKRMRETREIALKSQELGVAQQEQHMVVQQETLKMAGAQHKAELAQMGKKTEEKKKSGGGGGGAGGGGSVSLPLRQPPLFKPLEMPESKPARRGGGSGGSKRVKR